MTMKYPFNDCDRKSLVVAIGEILQIQPVYQGVPSFAYIIGALRWTSKEPLLLLKRLPKR
jgi:hypothetical protein